MAPENDRPGDSPEEDPPTGNAGTPGDEQQGQNPQKDVQRKDED